MVHRYSSKIVTFAIAVLMISLTVSGITNTAAQDDITFSLHRTFGTALGNNIQGTFTLSGTAPSTVSNLTVYFNDVQVHFEEGNTISWQFYTGDYNSGSVNITLIGKDVSGEVYSVTKSYVFFTGIQTNLITGGIIALVVVTVLVKYGSRLRKSSK